MNATLFLAVFALLAVGATAESFDKDTLTTSQGDAVITFIGHGTLMLEFDGKAIHVDPWSRLADYSELPKADLILVTHDHGDHFDKKTISLLSKDNTDIIVSKVCAGKVDAHVLENGQSETFQEIPVEAVPAYNIKHMRSENNPYHPKGQGNGYVLTLGNRRLYIAGDTEDIPEMKHLQNIDWAFLPMNLPYTMSPEMTAHAAKMIQPKILYPYHFGDTDPQKLVKLLSDTEIDVRIRSME